jgi:hypothetical protein
MKKALVLLVVMLMAISCRPAYANGGPGYSKSLLIGGGISFVDTPDIIVEKENLSINVAPFSTVVMAEYTLKNSGPAREIDYIFPITNYLFESGVAALEWIVFYDNGKKLGYSLTQKEEIPDIPEDSYGIKLEDDPAFFDALNAQEYRYDKILNNYYRTKLRFAEGEIKTLIVSYKTDNSFTSWGTSKDPFDYFSDAVFLYDFRPAAFWGNGKAAEFNLRFDYSELHLAHEISINIGNFTREAAGVFTYSEKDFSFADAGILSVKVDYPFEYLEYSPQRDWLKRVYTSSTLPGDNDRYSVRNLFDGDINTVWATDGNGIGAVIEIEFADVQFIGILNGFVRSKELYYDNARVKKLKVETGYHNGQKLLLGEGFEYEFDDTPYEELDKDLPRSSAVQIRANSYVRLTILEVYPGRKYQDVCLSEIYVLDWGTGRPSQWHNISDKPFIDDEQLVKPTEPAPSTIYQPTGLASAWKSEPTAAPETPIAAGDDIADSGGDNSGDDSSIVFISILCAVILCGAGFFGGVLYGARKTRKKNLENRDI